MLGVLPFQLHRLRLKSNLLQPLVASAVTRTSHRSEINLFFVVVENFGQMKVRVRGMPGLRGFVAAPQPAS